jgi:uncharacterized protein (TIGR03085 family)
MTALARRERTALCDLALAVGPDAPTLCGDWDATDLVTHLIVRERSPIGAAGIVVPPLAGLTDRAMARYRRRDFGVLVEKLRSPGLSPYALPPLEKRLNTLEYVVHHEDLRRAQPDWQSRTLPPADLDLVWSLVRTGSSFLGRALPAPTVLRRADTGAEAVARKGDDPVTVTGPVVELVLFLFGRSAVRGLTFDGPDDAVAAVRAADLGM